MQPEIDECSERLGLFAILARRVLRVLQFRGELFVGHAGGLAVRAGDHQAVGGFFLEEADALTRLGAAFFVVGLGLHRALLGCVVAAGDGRRAPGRRAAAAGGGGAGERQLGGHVLVVAFFRRVLAEVDLAVGVGPFVDLRRGGQRQAAQQEDEGSIHVRPV